MTKITFHYLLLTWLLLLPAVRVYFQATYPIYVVPSLALPYLLTFSDYFQIGSQRLVVTFMVRDITITNLPVRPCARRNAINLTPEQRLNYLESKLLKFFN